MNQANLELPIPVLKHPHWRVNFRPDQFNEELIPSLGNCLEIIQKTKLSLRGWDYPHLGRESQREYGNNWISSWSDFMGHNEYWRFFQSGQFIHLFSVREATEQDFKNHVKSLYPKIDWGTIPGFLSILNFVYTVTEIFEFAARLCESGLYEGGLTIDIRIKGIKGFILIFTDGDRDVDAYYSAGTNELGRSWNIETSVLIAESSKHALDAIAWFFERFGWLPPPTEIFRKDQENLLTGRI
jgi:hypothetical protein